MADVAVAAVASLGEAVGGKEGKEPEPVMDGRAATLGQPRVATPFLSSCEVHRMGQIG